MRVQLAVVKGPGKGTSWQFSAPGAFLIGRGQECDYKLAADDPYASRKHAYLEVCPPSCAVRNLSTTNPTRVNGEPVTDQRILGDGDRIEFGMSVIGVSIDCQTINPEEPQCSEIIPLAAAGDQRQPVARCHECGCVAESADSDGRAADFADVALYSCPACLPASDGGDPDRRRVFAEYTVIRKLGAGSMGSVYLGWHPGTWRLVAIKQINGLASREGSCRFEREVKALKEIRAKNVVRFFESGLHDGVPYLVTEYFPGGDLETLKSGAAVGGAVAVEIGIGLLSGIVQLHSRGIVHRDIKPANILLRAPTTRGASSAPVPAIADFGLVRSYAEAGGLRLTVPGTLLGTLMYMPPEQVRNPHAVTETADIYSAGVSIYYLLTSKYTFDFPTQADAAKFERRRGRVENREEAIRLLRERERIRNPFRIILEDEPVPIAHRMPGISTQLGSVIDRAVRKDSGARYQSAKEMKRDLEACAGNLGRIE